MMVNIYTHNITACGFVHQVHPMCRMTPTDTHCTLTLISMYAHVCLQGNKMTTAGPVLCSFMVGMKIVTVALVLAPHTCA